MSVWTIIICSLLVAFVIIIIVSAVLNRNKQLKCPNCDHVFNAPIMDQKLSGFGWSVPYLGTVQCSKCGVKRSRRDYNKVEHQNKKTE